MDSLLPIPSFIERPVAAAVFFSGVFLVAAHTLILARAAERAGLPPNRRWRLPALAAGFLAAWFALALVVGDAAHFPLPSEAWRLPLSGALSFGPLLIALLLLWKSPTLRAANAATPPEWLIGVQLYRTLGLVFVFPYGAYGVLPPGFAWSAGIGDFITGALAPFVAGAVRDRKSYAFPLAVAWSAFGILDLIVAPVMATVTHAHVLGHHPLALVPLFVGPPLGILTHIFALRALIAARRTEAAPVSRFGVAATV